MAAVPQTTHSQDMGLTFSINMTQFEAILSSIDLLLRDSEPRTQLLYQRCPSHKLHKTEELLSSTLLQGTHEHSDGRDCRDPNHEFWAPGGWKEAPIKFVRADDASIERSRSPFNAVCGVHLYEEKMRFAQGAKALHCFFLPLEGNISTPSKYWGAVYGLVEVGNLAFNLKQAFLTKNSLGSWEVLGFLFHVQ